MTDDWLTPADLNREINVNGQLAREAEALEELLGELQPEWCHSLLIGTGGKAAVVSEMVR